MLSYVTIEGHDAIVLDDDKRLWEVLGPQLQQVMELDKTQASSLLTGKRGGFFLLNIDDPAELYGLLGPKIYGTCRVEAQPVTPIEQAGEIFQQWAAEGR